MKLFRDVRYEQRGEERGEREAKSGLLSYAMQLCCTMYSKAKQLALGEARSSECKMKLLLNCRAAQCGPILHNVQYRVSILWKELGFIVRSAMKKLEMCGKVAFWGGMVALSATKLVVAANIA